MKHLGGSGGSTKGAGILGAWISAYDHGYYPDIISGISVSAIIGVPFALGYHNKLARLFHTLQPEDIFSLIPVNKKGNPTFLSLIRLALGKSMGKQKAVIELLKDMVPEAKFDAYKKSPSYPDVIVMAVNFKNGSREYRNAKSLTYAQWLKWTLASASIPMVTPGVEIDGSVYYDGGVRDHCIGHYIMENYAIQESVSVYSRPFDLQDMPEWTGNNGLDALLRSIDIMSVEVSKNDEALENMIAFDRGIKHRQIYLPWILKSLYDTNNCRLKSLYEAGYQAYYAQ